MQVEIISIDESFQSHVEFIKLNGNWQSLFKHNRGHVDWEDVWRMVFKDKFCFSYPVDKEQSFPTGPSSDLCLVHLVLGVQSDFSCFVFQADEQICHRLKFFPNDSHVIREANKLIRSRKNRTSIVMSGSPYC